MNRIFRTIHAFVRGPVLALALCTSAVALTGAASAFAAPAIDGNLDDMITYANDLNTSGAGCGLYITDKPDGLGNPTPETIYNDLKFIPCPQPQPVLGSHWVNGVEIFRHVFAYTPGSTKLYLGLRAEGFIGDGDGNGNPDNAGGGSCNPNDNIEDTFGISGNELYSWSFDLNCDGSTDGSIKVQDNAVSGTGTLAGATGTLAFRQGGSATGHDLELEINLPAPLPPAFRFVRVEANAFDGLSEDRSDGAVCIANPAIAVVKSAVPVSVCAGANTRFSIEVSNTGQTPLSVVVVDQLPAQLSYAGGLSSGCGVGAPVVNGQQLTFPAFNLAAGAICTISFDAAASLQCFGSQNNVVDVTGTFSSACIAEGGAISKTAHAEFAVVCKSPPCVEVTASGPDAACPGAPVTIEGTAKNCSLDAELIVVTVNGAQAYSNTVAAGQTINWSLNTTLPAECTAGQNSSFAVVATGSGDCGTDTKNTSVLVRCKDKPCVELTADRNPAAACPGDAITVSGTVKNCSLEPETIVVTINGQQVFNQVVAAGATAQYSQGFTMPACVAGNNVDYVVHATATGDCLPVANDEETVSVLCKNPPCVELTADRNPASACPGDAVTISGTVKNCSPAAENIVVTVNGEQVFSGSVAAGATQNYSKSTVMPACTAGQNVPWTVVAIATNDCDAVGQRKEQTVNVACKNPPCVDVTAQANKAAACPNEAVIISGVVKNCGADAASYTVTVGGVQVFAGELAAGAEQAYQREVSMGACTAGNSVSWDVVAHASNSCGNDEEQKSVSVRCKDLPCVELVADRNPASACPGDAVTIFGSVKNCSIDAETIVVTVNGEQVFSGVVQPGATQEYSKSTVMPACTAGQNVPWTVVAVATNDCDAVGQRKEQTVNVQCKTPPCVDLIDVHANVDAACPGAPVIVSGSVKNCGNDAADYTVTVGGVQVFSGSLAAGQSAAFQREVSMGACVAGSNVTFAVAAHAANSCGVDDENTSVSVRCKDVPCVELTAAREPDIACPGADVTIHGTVKNCSSDAETIVVTVNGVQVLNQVVAAGATVNYTTTLAMPECAAGSQVPFNVVATATGDCNPPATKNASLSVICRQGPCVQAQAQCNPAAACPGTPITVTGSAKNCGVEPADITISIEGQSQSFPQVPAGQTVSWNREFVLRECTSGEKVSYNVLATATNPCGAAKPSTDACSVVCLKPEIEIEKTVSPEGAVDQGTTLHYTIVVTNPSHTVALRDVKVTDELCSEVTYQGNAVPTPTSAPGIGGNGAIVWDIPSIAARSSVTITFDVRVTNLERPACESENRSCTNHVSVDGYCGDAKAHAEDSVNTPINPCPAPGLCRLTGGGCMNDNPDTGNKGHKQSTFGGNSSPEHDGGGPTGNSWEHVYRDGRTILFNWHSWDAHVIACSVVPPGPCSPKAINTRADFVGTGKYSLGAGSREEDGNQVAYIIDHREGSCNKGTRDEYSIIVRKGLVIGEGEIVFQATGYIDCGNLQIHETPGRLFGAGNGISIGEGTSGVELLNRPYPNPFTGSTSFAYKVAGDGASVDVGVYNVAGRLVKTLAAGPQSAGTYTVTWDGSDAAGVRMAPGVYFLKSKVGSEQTVSRLIYVSR